MAMFSTNPQTLRRERLFDQIGAIVKGLFLFIPAFFLSLFFTIPWARYHWAGEAQAPLGAIGPSFWIGVVSAAWGCWYFLRKVNRDYKAIETPPVREA